MRAITILIKPASSLCNMRCRYCFYHDVADNRKIYSFGLMTEAVMHKLIDSAFESVDKGGVINFFFQGGEPTLCGLDFYKKFVGYVEECKNKKFINIQYSLQTNGILIDDAFAKFFGENKFLIGLSLDGTKELHDLNRICANGEPSFLKVKRASDLLFKHNVDFNILCVITLQHANKGVSIYNFLKKNNYRFIQFIPQIAPFHDDEGYNYPLLSAEGYSRFLKDIFDVWYRDFSSGNYVSIRDFDNYASVLIGKAPEICTLQGQCSCNFVAEANGNVYPCDFYVLDDYLLGNINNISFSDMLKSPVAKEFVEMSKANITDECKNCKWFGLCRTGCRRNKEPLEKTFGRNYFCAAYKDFFEYSIERFQKVPAVLKQKY